MDYSIRKLMLVAFMFMIGPINAYSVPSILEGTLLISPDSSVAVPISGALDVSAGTINIDSFVYRSSPFTVVSGEFLQPGIHYKTIYNGSSGFSRYTIIDEGNVGGYFVMSWNGEAFGVFMHWTYDESLQTYTSIPFFGNSIKQGSLTGNDLTIDLGATEQGSFVHPSITVVGGNTQECSQTGGAMVSLNVTATMSSGASLSRVDWVIDGESIPDEVVNVSVFSNLGSHTVEATATTNQGATEATSASFTVVDSTIPSLSVFFVDSLGQTVTTAAAGDVEIQFVADDVCDPSPVVQNGGATPIMNVESGDLIRIVQQDGNVIIPTTGVRVTARAIDATGNQSSTSNTLIIE